MVPVLSWSCGCKYMYTVQLSQDENMTVIDITAQFSYIVAVEKLLLCTGTVPDVFSVLCRSEIHGARRCEQKEEFSRAVQTSA